uniref:Large subunit ribosomal protein L21e n=1 Tax=Tetraselmis sp. GSL018 TaxID=582737 RepID=A0A061SEP2_9CHLO
MGRAHGLRSRTRDSFSRGFRKKGVIPLSTYLRNYKVGDYVDIKVNAAQQKGMPFKVYHGRTGIVWNVTKRAVGVEVNKEVNGRIMKKRIHVRVEHVHPSRCHESFVNRVKANDDAKHQAKEKGEPIPKCKRQPKGPREGFVLENVKPETITAIPYDIIKEGLLG